MKMDFTDDIVDLYSAVLTDHEKRFTVQEKSFRDAVRKLGEAYAVDPSWELQEDSKKTNYNDAAHRRAYLHKYAMIHTGVVCELLGEAMKIYPVKTAIESGLNLCSLGSGPGTDIVSLIFIFAAYCDKEVQRNATLIDCSEQWKEVFDTIVRILKTDDFQHVNPVVSTENFSYTYMSADLLKFDQNDRNVYEAIHRADIITMVKFISAAGCKDTRSMIKEIFDAMKPGAMLLFVDNAGGKFFEMMSEIASTSHLILEFGPEKHREYEKQEFNRQYYNIKSQHEATVTAAIWRKATGSHDCLEESKINQARFQCISNEDFPSLPAYPQSALIFGRTSDEVDYSPKDSFRLQPENAPESQKESPCCTIM